MIVRFRVQHIDIITDFVVAVRWENDLFVEDAFDGQVLIEFLIDHWVVGNALFDFVNHIHSGRLAVGRGRSMLQILMVMMD